MSRSSELVHAQTLLDSGRADEALVSAGRALASNPDDVEALVVAASALIALDRHRDALAEAERAVSLDPSHPGALRAVAFARLRLRDFDGALDAAREGVRLEPHDWSAWVNLSTVARVPDRLSKEAFHAAGRALQLAPNLPDTHRAMGNLWFRRREWRAAAWEYRMALRLDPHDLESQRLLNLVIRETGNFTESAVEFARLSAMDPGDASHDHNLRVTLSDELFGSMGGVVLAFLLETTTLVFALQPGFPYWGVQLIMFAIALIAVALVARSLRRSTQRLGERLGAMVEYVRVRDRLLMSWGVIQGAALLALLIAPLIPFPGVLVTLGGAAAVLFGAWIVWVIRSWRGGR